MKYMDKICVEEELMGWMQKEESIVLYGNKSLVLIMLRWCREHNLLEKVSGLCYEKTKTEYMDFLEKTVKPVDLFYDETNTKVIVLAYDEQACNQLLENMLETWKEEQIAYVDYGLLAQLSQRDNVTLDFLCVGSVKCGTTSLYQALKQNKKIYIPKEKEIMYNKWKNKDLDAPERFKELYFSGVSQKRVWGCIEPTFYNNAHFVYQNFGTHPKILFMMRNPADATFSFFKMMMKRSSDSKQREYYHRHGKFSDKMFQEYLQDYIFSRKDQRFAYDIWLKEYLQFYPKEAIMVIFLEEIIKEPERVLREVQEFIGVEPIEIKELPHSNSGTRVARNYLSARINGKLHKLFVDYKATASRKKQLQLKKLRNFVWKYTLVENTDKMDEADRTRLLTFYSDSIKEVERITGKSLKGLWYD